MLIEKGTPEKKKPTRGDVIIIEDNPSICILLKKYCVNMGCFRNIIIAQDGFTGSNKLRNQKFALIIMDMQLPRKSGLEILREMDDKSLNSKDSILIASGELDKMMLEKAMAVGVKFFLTKPFAEAEFQEKVLKLLVPVKKAGK